MFVSAEIGTTNSVGSSEKKNSKNVDQGERGGKTTPSSKTRRRTKRKNKRKRVVRRHRGEVGESEDVEKQQQVSKHQQEEYEREVLSKVLDSEVCETNNIQMIPHLHQHPNNNFSNNGAHKHFTTSTSQHSNCTNSNPPTLRNACVKGDTFCLCYHAKRRRVCGKFTSQQSQSNYIPDVIFTIIFDFLNVKDLFSNVLLVNKRLHGLIYSPSTWVRRNFETCGILQKKKFTHLLNHCSFRHLILNERNMVNKEAIEQIPLQLRHLKTIALHDVDISIGQIASILVNCPSLSYFELRDSVLVSNKSYISNDLPLTSICPHTYFKSLEQLKIVFSNENYEKNQIVDTYFKQLLMYIMQSSPKLKTVCIIQNCIQSLFFHWICDEVLQACANICNNIQNLELGGHSRITDEGLSKVLACNPNLRRLTISNCEMITFNTLRVLSKFNYHLKSLGVYSCKRIPHHMSIGEKLRTLPNLDEFGFQQYRCCDQHEQLDQDVNTLLCKRLLTELCPSSIQRISLDTHHAFSIEEIMKDGDVLRQCSNLQTIDLVNCDISDKTIYALVENCKSSHLHLSLLYSIHRSTQRLLMKDETLILIASKCNIFVCENCEFSSNWLDILAEHGKNLQSLGLARLWVPKAPSTSLPNLVIERLNTLTLGRLDFISDSYMEIICKYCPNVKCLRLYEIENISGQIFKYISQYLNVLECLNLQSCHFNNCDNLQCSELKCLRELGLIHSSHISLNSFLCLLLSLPKIERFMVEFDYDSRIETETRENYFRQDLVNGMDCNFFAEFQKCIKETFTQKNAAAAATLGNHQTNWEWDIFCDILKQRIAFVIDQKLLNFTRNKKKQIKQAAMQLMSPENVSLVLTTKKVDNADGNAVLETTILPDDHNKVGLECTIPCFFKKCFLESLFAFADKF